MHVKFALYNTSTRCQQSKHFFLNASFAQNICRAGFKQYKYMANDHKFLFSKSSEVFHVLFSRRIEFVQKLDHTLSSFDMQLNIEQRFYIVE